MTAEPLVQLESVSRASTGRRGPRARLLDVTLALPAHELAVVHGRSGSGKTTLLNMIGGLEARRPAEWWSMAVRSPRFPRRRSSTTAAKRSGSFSSRSG